MDYILMNRQTPILNCTISKQQRQEQIFFEVKKVNDLYHVNYLPVGVTYKKEQVDRRSLNDWFRNRKIPASLKF